MGETEELVGVLTELGVSGRMKLRAKRPVEDMKPCLGIGQARQAKAKWEGDGTLCGKDSMTGIHV